MPLIYCGIDEAGYGPLLGPLCVAAATFRIDSWTEGSPAPNLWNVLSTAVCRKPSRSSGGRIAIDDSKKLKLANSSTAHHPVVHLERGVLTFLAASGTQPVETDEALFGCVGASLPAEPWYCSSPHPCPRGLTGAEIGIAANVLRGELTENQICVQSMRCVAISESSFNEIVAAAGTKAAATEAALVRHLWSAWEQHGEFGAAHGNGVRVVCDQQGGRTQYAGVLSRAFPEAEVTILEEAPGRSKYQIAAADGSRKIVVQFQPEAEAKHMPVALASMLAKLTREMMMARFNAYWCARMPELKPTAGYRNDGWRWLEDVKDVITSDERGMLIRRAQETLVTEARRMLDLAARIACRAAGHVEPNPMVGAVLVRAGQVIGMGHHKQYGGLHAEVEAIMDCMRRGENPRGATFYVTLEPCDHQGKQPPCSRAVIAAGITNVVAARRDPNPVSGGGEKRLREAGIAFEFSQASRNAIRLSDPFVKRIETGLPWVIAKWAQTIDGRVATRTGESKWISGDPSRRRVHHLRARVDAIISGIGTVQADDPMLTSRGVPLRRIATRVVLDRRLELSPESRLVRSAKEAPLVLITSEQAAALPAAESLRRAGAHIHTAPLIDGRIDLEAALRLLATEFNATNVMLECGPRMVGAFLKYDLIDEAHVYVGPMLIGDEDARPPASGMEVPRIGDATRWELGRIKRIGADALLTYRRQRKET